MQIHSHFTVRTILRKQAALVEVFDSDGLALGTVTPSRALGLVMDGSFSASGDTETVRSLRPTFDSRGRKNVGPVPESSLTTIGPQAGHRQYRDAHRQHHSDRCNRWMEATHDG